MSEVYSTPKAKLESEEKSTSSRLAFWSIALQFAPFIGMLMTAVAMFLVFDDLATRTGAGKSAILAEKISTALWSTCIGLVIGIIGLIMHFTALIKQQYRSPWFYKWTMFFAILNLFNFPLGTAISVYLISYITKRKAEFFN